MEDRKKCTGRDAQKIPRVEYDLDSLFKNVDALVKLSAQRGISLVGVTKGIAGNPDIAQVLRKGGVQILADARLQNIQRLRKSGYDGSILLIRPPTLYEIPLASKLVDLFLLSDRKTISSLAAVCQNTGQTAEIILMVELGDLREGVQPDDLPRLVDYIETLEGVKIVGIGSNHACHLGIMPDVDNMQVLSELAKIVERRLDRKLQFVSAGNSSAYTLMQKGKLPPEINQLRFGEAILLGCETAKGQPIAGTRQDVFKLYAQVIELGIKTFEPQRKRGRNALGKGADQPLSGDRKLALLNVGAVDTEISGLSPINPALKIIGGSSDHLIADISEIADISIGDEFGFSLNYHALATAMSSPYILQSRAAIGNIKNDARTLQHSATHWY